MQTTSDAVRHGIPGNLRGWILLAIAAAFPLAGASRCGGISAPRDGVAAAIQEESSFAENPLQISSRAIYETRGYRPIWSRGAVVRHEAVTFIETIRAAGNEGLDPHDYGIEHIDSLWDELARAGESSSPEVAETGRTLVLALLDKTLTEAFLVFGAHQAGGRVHPKTFRRRVLDGETFGPIAAELARAEEEGWLDAAIGGLSPDRGGYRALARELTRVRAEENGGDPRVVETLLVNLERRRWLPREPEPRRVVVNIAAYSLSVYEAEEEVLAMRVVVGKRYRETPLIDSRITHIVLNPPWYVTEHIASEDIIPEVKKDPRYLANRNIRVLDGIGEAASEVDPASIDWENVDPKSFKLRFRQDPGASNALGRMKFVFPNNNDIYLHDTPQTNLFERDVRTFSSGCIRLEKPLELAELLLGDDPRWMREGIEEAIRRRATKWIPLPNAVPIHLLYWTAWVDGEGRVVYADDIYRWDAKLSKALSRPQQTYSSSS